jgi:phenylacetate-coenzyme A ligase PaaK-like adenylate-forming protein
MQQIKQVFNVPISSSYGSTETGFVFMQCEKGKFHQNSEFCRVDFEPLKPEHGGPQLGRILVTTFNNPWYYLIHFDVGDIVVLDENNKCPCGRDTGLLLTGIAGRISNLTTTETGRLVTLHQLDNEISVMEGIDEYRLDQIGLTHYHLQLVSQRHDRIKLQKEAKEILRKLYGEKAEISVSYKAYITPEKSGKYHLTSNALPINIKRYLAAKSMAYKNILNR